MIYTYLGAALSVLSVLLTLVLRPDEPRHAFVVGALSGAGFALVTVGLVETGALG